MKTIKTSKLSINFANAGKIDRLSSFIDDYQKAVSHFVDFLFKNKISYKVKDKQAEFDISSDKLDCPLFFPPLSLDFETDLSARALKCASTQACSIVRGTVSKRKKLLHARKMLSSSGKRTRSITRKISRTPVLRPDLSKVNPELNSICCSLHDSELEFFDNVIVLSSIGKKYGKIVIPVKHSRHSRKLEAKGRLLKSFLVCRDNIQLRYEIELPGLKEHGSSVGADQGMSTCVSLSDRQATMPCRHGHDLKSIARKLARKKNGSKAFARAKEHQKNYVNWSISQLDFSGIRTLKLEKLSNFRYKKNIGRFLNHFGEPLIRKKMVDKARQEGVLVVEQSSAFRSQRCSQCGWVCRSSRKGKDFSCKRCSFRADADYNASCNHEANLPPCDWIRHLADKPKEFFWKEEGIFDLQGQELAVPGTTKEYKR